MPEPIRHEASQRNRRKALHFAENLRDELEFLRKQHTRRIVNLDYCLDRIYKLLNRMKAEK